ncbi:hypothetical protein EFR84_30595 [Rhizobium chutanense]|uniref:Uncharacterized protein n=1 Tax=Rhizobium chutanense TaxID=2035448 RepID=A0A432ND74_9HYPH|nr:hypothetical protein EFR84_30595 [Rhizobium chutanense]
MTGFRKIITKWKRNRVDSAENSIEMVIFVVVCRFFEAELAKRKLSSRRKPEFVRLLYVSH